MNKLQTRALDFAKRMCFKGYENLTDKRREKLWSDAEWFLTDCFNDSHKGWETGGKDSLFLACDWFHERFDEKYFPNTTKWDKRFEAGEQPKYLDQLNFICRAALDLVDDWKGMCWGWTIGDFKRMYDGELPQWFPKSDWHILGDGKISFESMTDETKIAV